MNAAILISLAAQIGQVVPFVIADIEPALILHEQIVATSVSADLLPDNRPAVRKVVITGYSSTADKTDDTPFITASGKRVRDGIVASNFLKFGTRIKIPSVFGDKIFVVEDRMHARFSNRVDIWFSTREQAMKLGKREVEIIVL